MYTFFPRWLVSLYSHCWSFKVCVRSNVKHYANFMLSHVFISSLDLKSHHKFELYSQSALIIQHVYTLASLFFHICSLTALYLPIKFRQLDVSKRSFISISEWAISVANRMLFLLLTKSTFWSAEFYSVYKNLESVLVNFLNDDKYFSSNKVCERNIKLFRRSKKTLSTTIFLPSLKYSRFWWRGKRSKVFQIYWMKWRALPWISVPWFIDYVIINWL